MNCKDKGYEEGQAFKYIGKSNFFDKGAILVLIEDDGTQYPYFKVIANNHKLHDRHPGDLERMVRIYPPEKETVTVECEGNKVEISRESAKALNLI